MPALLVGVARFPSTYSPWYIFLADLQATPGSFTYLDMLIPNSSGLFALETTTDDVLTTGYAFALEAYDGVMTQVQVAVPGSVVPMIADNTLRPCCLVKFVYASSAQNVTIAAAADLAAGKVIGRYMCHYLNHEELVVTATSDPILVLTGAC